MTSMKSDLVGRIERLPEPRNTADALQPLFEAIMNAVQATQEKFKERTSKKGVIDIVIKYDKNLKRFSATITDNGIGLDDKNYQAFITTDTDNKIEKGGKGVGRLLWLACFPEIKISSTFKSKRSYFYRSFKFELQKDEQITNESIDLIDGKSDTGFSVHFSQIKEGAYRQKFPRRKGYLFQHLLSHFLPVMIGGNSPKIHILCNGEEKTFPDDISVYIYRRLDLDVIHEENEFKIQMLECDKSVSSNLSGSNFIHFIANHRTVMSRPIDGKLGIRAFGDDSHVFHAIVSGAFLDKNVSQERTMFLFGDEFIDDLINDSLIQHISEFLSDPLSEVHAKQLKALENISDAYPSIAFGTPEELAQSVPPGEIREEQLYGVLSIERHRRDRRQREKINQVIESLRGEGPSIANFESELISVTESIAAEEKRSLAEYVVRRRIILRLMRELLRSYRQKPEDMSYQLESSLHNFICPVRVVSGELKAASHDLWVIDERLTFAKAFSSDAMFKQFLEDSDSEDRPDIIVFDAAFGLSQSDDSPRVLIVEFKRPGRSTYPDSENPQFQIQRYIEHLRSVNSVNFDGRPRRLPSNAIFNCFLVADRRGKLAEWTSSWALTPDGRGRIYTMQGDYRGFIELIEWDSLIDDAEERNKAFFDAAGI